jgi:trimeric autotransporter adhesin
VTTIANPGAVESVELVRAGQVLPMEADVRKAARAAPRAGAAWMAATAFEAAGQLHLIWDATREPFVTVSHVGSDGLRSVLALSLDGGNRSLPTAGLPSRGRFEISYASKGGARLVVIDR